MAKGKYDSECALENTELSENDNLDISVLEDELTGLPLLAAERDEYVYPISIAEFKLLKANPYGTIRYSTSENYQEGWIDSVSYKPEQGLATFKLIPKYN